MARVPLPGNRIGDASPQSHEPDNPRPHRGHRASARPYKMVVFSESGVDSVLFVGPRACARADPRGHYRPSSFLPLPVDQVVERRHQEEGEYGGDKEAEDQGPGQAAEDRVEGDRNDRQHCRAGG